MVRTRERTLGQVLRERRRQLDLTQEELARRIKTSTPTSAILNPPNVTRPTRW